MKNTLFFTLFILGSVCLVSLYFLYHYYTGPIQKQSYKFCNSTNDTINIAYIGDSWAFLHKDHSCQIDKILEDSLCLPFKIFSYGLSGLTSRDIYESIFENEDFKQFLQKRNYKFCFISAGINDTNMKMDTSYYKKSMDYIIQIMLENHIRPIILEIPDYDIISTYYRYRLCKKLFLRFSSWITDSPIDCKQLFRETLDDLIIEKGYMDNVSIIRYRSWNKDKANDWNSLYKEDRMHLNAKGYAVLDSAIAIDIIRTINSN